MTTKSETLFCNRINKCIPRAVEIEKMHNPYRGGTADYWYSGFRDDLWVEYKWILLARGTASKAIKPKATKLQLIWLNNHHNRGRNVCVIIGSPNGCAILLDGEWNNKVPGNKFHYTEREVANWIVKQTHVEVLASTHRSDKPGVQNRSNIVDHRGDGN